MAESLVQVTEGSGKKLHTNSRVIGANTVEDEVVLLGENYLSSYTISTTTTSTATGLSHLLQVMAGASLKVRIRRIEVHQTVAATAAALMEVAVIRLTTAGTGGSVQVPSLLDQTDGGSGATAMTLPTVKGTESSVIWFGAAYLMQTIAASAQLNNPIVTIDFDRPRSKPLIISAGAANGICIRNSAAHAGASVRTIVWLDESNF